MWNLSVNLLVVGLVAFFLISQNSYLSMTILVKTSDVPYSLSGSGSGRILPFLSDIRIRPDLNIKKKFRVRFRPDPYRDPADFDLVSKKEYTEKYFFKNKPCISKKSHFVQVVELHQFITRISHRAYLHFVS